MSNPAQRCDQKRSMVENGVIHKADVPTDWVNSLAYSRKQNWKLCICLEPTFRRCHLHILEQITHQFAGSQHFSKLDAKNGYWSVKLDAESQNPANNLQFAIWKVSLPAYALGNSDVPRCFLAADRPDPWEMPRNPGNRGWHRCVRKGEDRARQTPTQFDEGGTRRWTCV